MIFADLPQGASGFLDANTLVYHFGPDPALRAACRDLLVRIKRQEIQGFTSAHVLTEASHRLMTMEAIDRFGWPAAGIARRLRAHPADVQSLTVFRRAIQDIPHYGIPILVIPPDQIDAAAAISQQTGLLSNDALIVAVMQANRLTNLASNDDDFDRVPGLTPYAPI